MPDPDPMPGRIAHLRQRVARRLATSRGQEFPQTGEVVDLDVLAALLAELDAAGRALAEADAVRQDVSRVYHENEWLRAELKALKAAGNALAGIVRDWDHVWANDYGHSQEAADALQAWAQALCPPLVGADPRPEVPDA